VRWKRCRWIVFPSPQVFGKAILSIAPSPPTQTVRREVRRLRLAAREYDQCKTILCPPPFAGSRIGFFPQSAEFPAGKFYSKAIVAPCILQIDDVTGSLVASHSWRATKRAAKMMREGTFPFACAEKIRVLSGGQKGSIVIFERIRRLE